MAAAKLHMLRQRMDAGRVSKVLRGEYVQHLPTGLVRQSIELVVTTFAEVGSCQKVLRFFKQHDLLLPRRQTSGFHKGELCWRQPSAAAIYEILQNPAYAGACVDGRRPTDPRRRIPGRPATGVVRKPLAEWAHIRHQAYPASIPWEQYLTNQARRQDNALGHHAHTRPGRGAPREGAALLQGLATWGVCGHRMKTAYKAGVRYVCDGLSKEFAEPMGASLDGPSIATCVVQAFFAAIQPAQLDALEALLAQQRQERARLERYWADQVQRATYEAHLARRRYEAVDPDNRLVAAELEHRWEAQLVACRQIQEAADRFRQAPLVPALDPTLRHQLAHIAHTLPELWASGQLTPEHKQRLLRSLVARVLLKRVAPDDVEVKIVWMSGHCSVDHVTPPIHRQPEVSRYDEVVRRIHTLWQEGHRDPEIAATLTQAGFHSARRRVISAQTVLNIRNQQGWLSRLHHHRHADKLDGWWTIHGLAKTLGVDRNWFYRRIYHGLLHAPAVVRQPPYGNYLIRDDPELMQRLHAEVATMRHPRRRSHA